MSLFRQNDNCLYGDNLKFHTPLVCAVAVLETNERSLRRALFLITTLVYTLNVYLYKKITVQLPILLYTEVK